MSKPNMELEIGKGRSKKCGDQNGEKQELWRFSKRKKRKRMKECFESGMKNAVKDW